MIKVFHFLLCDWIRVSHVLQVKTNAGYIHPAFLSRFGQFLERWSLNRCKKFVVMKEEKLSRTDTRGKQKREKRGPPDAV